MKGYVFVVECSNGLIAVCSNRNKALDLASYYKSCGSHKEIVVRKLNVL